jgi:hypothetical protein
LTLPHGASKWQSNRIVPKGKTPDEGAAIASFNQQLCVVYTAGGNGLQYSTLNADFSLEVPTPIAPSGHAAATDAALSLTTVQNSLVVLHKGESSDNLWFSVGIV